MKEIFDIVDKKIVINHNCLLIPQFKILIDKYGQDAINVLSYVYYFTDFRSPFADYSEDQRIDTLMEMFNKNGVFTLEDRELIDALKLYKDLQWTVAMELLDGTREAMFKMAAYLKTTEVVDGKDGNASQIATMIKNIGSTLASYDDLTNQVEKELQKTTIRGNKHISKRER